MLCFPVQRIREEKASHPVIILCPEVSTQHTVEGKGWLPCTEVAAEAGQRDLFAISHFYSSLMNPRTGPHNDLLYVLFVYKISLQGSNA